MRSAIAAPTALALALAGGLVPHKAAHAQDLQIDAPTVEVPEGLFVPTPITVGSAVVAVGASARLEYDSNIYALAFDEKDDFKLLVRPYVGISRKSGALELNAQAEGDFRKFFKYNSEDAVGGRVAAEAAWTPSAMDKINAAASWQHIIEDRGEPEGLTTPSTGPRELDAFIGDLSYKRQGVRLGFMVRGTVARFRYESVNDENRDLDNFGLSGRAMMRVSPLMNAFVEGFVSKREFRLAPAPGELNRDSHTYGGRVGVAIDPGGTVTGDAAVGVYRFDPKDPLIEPRTGISAEASITYSPRQRTSITASAFMGNVATYRSGVQSREDMRFRLGVSQEIRHNLRADAGLVYRRSKFFGSGAVDRIYGASGELEYSLNRRVALALSGNLSKRDSSDPLDDFERARVGLTLRVHY